MLQGPLVQTVTWKEISRYCNGQPIRIILITTFLRIYSYNVTFGKTQTSACPKGPFTLSGFVCNLRQTQRMTHFFAFDATSHRRNVAI